MGDTRRGDSVFIDASPISVTDLGIAIFLSEVQLMKAQFPISIVPSGMMATPSLISNFAIILLVISLSLSSSRGQALQLCRATPRADASCSSRPSWQERKL